MTDFANGIDENCKFKCRGCLAYNENLRPMAGCELFWYKNIISEVKTDTMYICLNCRFIIKKLMVFTTQCQKIYDLLSNEISKDIEFKPILSLTITAPETFYIGEVVMKSEESDDDAINNDEMVMSVKKCEDSDENDDVPLNMLKGDNCFQNSKILNEDSKTITENKKTKKKAYENSKQEKKQLKIGFSPRMVQETNEYTVIKLTKEQVKEELSINSQSDKYLRALYKCDRCVKGFNFEDVLRTHMEKHSKENGEFLCDICQQYCPTAVSLRGHMKSHTTRYKCKVCGDVRLSRQHLLEHHAISHTDAATKYSCQNCYFTTNKRTVIQRHVRTHKATEKLTCTHCGRNFQNVETLRVHVTRRHDKSRSLQCPQCSRKFIYPSLLQKHIQAVHVYKDYYCVECDIRFKSPDNLKLHFKKAKKHRDMSSYTHECPQCCERFVTSSALLSHLTSSHGHPKKYVCEHCSRLYSSRESLKGHIRRVHDDKQTTAHSCELCNKAFTNKNLLHTHIQTHENDKCA